MKDETSQALFKKYGVFGAILVVLGAIIAAMVIGFVGAWISAYFGAELWLAKVIGFGVGAGALNLGVSLARR